MKGSIIIAFLVLNTVMITVAESTINCYKCANSSALAEHDWRIFNITIDPYAYKPCAPKVTTQKRKIIYRGCFDKKIRLEEKRKINGERRFHVMVTCQRSLCNSAVGLSSHSTDSFLGRLYRWFRLSDPRLNWLTSILLNDKLMFISSLHICFKWFYLSNILSDFIHR